MEKQKEKFLQKHISPSGQKHVPTCEHACLSVSRYKNDKRQEKNMQPFLSIFCDLLSGWACTLQGWKKTKEVPKEKRIKM